MTRQGTYPSVQALPITDSHPGPLVVLIARTARERLQLVARIGSAGPVLIVSSAQEAQRVLHPGSTDTSGPATPATGPESISDSCAVPGMRLLPDRNVATFSGHEIALTPLEFALLSCLTRRTEKVQTFAALSGEVWGTTHLGDVSQVHAVVKRLRRKLVTLRAPLRIEAIRGIGFRAVPIRTLQPVGAPVS